MSIATSLLGIMRLIWLAIGVSAGSAASYMLMHGTADTVLVEAFLASCSVLFFSIGAGPKSCFESVPCLVKIEFHPRHIYKLQTIATSGLGVALLLFSIGLAFGAMKF